MYARITWEKNAPAHSCGGQDTARMTGLPRRQNDGYRRPREQKRETERHREKEREGKKERPPTRDREREKTQVRRGEQSWRRIGKSDLGGAGTAVLSEEKKRKSGEKEAVPYCGPAFVPKTHHPINPVPKLTTDNCQKRTVEGKVRLLRKIQTPNRPMNHSLPFFGEILIKMWTDGRYQDHG